MADKALDYFTKVLEDNLKAVIKPQYVDQLPKALRNMKSEDRTVEKLLKSRSQMDNYEEIVDAMGKMLSNKYFLKICLTFYRPSTSS